MRIAIHKRPRSFSDRWIPYCEEKQIDWKPVDCYRSDIMEQLEDCDALMWHFSHISPKDFLMARQVLYSAKAAGKKVFPDFATSWHFDDKVGQKYLLEAVGAPVVPTWVFYDKREASKWIDQTQFPKVFKLRCGSSARNVRLVRSRRAARKLVRNSFGKGIRTYDPFGNVKERWRKYKLGMTGFREVVDGVARILIPPAYARMMGREKGYLYFQEFIQDSEFDIRMYVISGKAFGVKRLARKNDFRASGSGYRLPEKELIDMETVRMSFELAEKLCTQVLSLDFIFKDDKPLIVEISYGFGYTQGGPDVCPGYWDKQLNWHEGPVDATDWMVDLMLS